MTQTKWISEAKTAANDCDKSMPWTRGLRRQEMIARRLESDNRSAKISLAPMPEFMMHDISA